VSAALDASLFATQQSSGMVSPAGDVGEAVALARAPSSGAWSILLRRFEGSISWHLFERAVLEARRPTGWRWTGDAIKPLLRR